MVLNKLGNNSQENQNILTSNSAKLGFWEFDIIRSHLYYSEEVYNIFGITPGKIALSNEKLIKMIHNEDRETVKKVYAKSLENGNNNYEIKYRLIKQDTKEIRLMLEKCEHRKNKTGQVVSSIGIIQDITNQKQLEDKYRQLLESTETILWEYDIIEDKWTYLSPKVEQKLGYSPEEWTNLEFWKNCIHPEDRTWAVNYCSKYAEEGKPHIFEYRFVKKDGTIAYISDNVKVEMLKGEPVKLRGSMVDITNQKLANQKAHYYTKEAKKAKKQMEAEIENARQIHERTFIGKRSEIDNLKDVSLEAHYHPAKQIGGDFYNFIKVRDKLIIYLSDVTGHGMEAAIISSFVKESIRNYVKLRPEELSLKKILRHLDQQYREEEFPDDYFVCIFMAVLDLNTYELSYTGTGMQFSPFVKLANGNCIHLQSKGPPISSTVPQELMNFDTDSIILSPGSIVLFYTDGIAEQRDLENNFYEERLKNIFFTQKNKFPPELIKQVINTDFMEFNGSLQGDDDITYVILQINPPERKHYSWKLDSSLEEIEKFYSKVVPIINNFINEKSKIQGLYELIINAMGHGNKYDPDKKIYIDLVLTDDYIFVTVADEGEGFNWKQVLNTSQDITNNEEQNIGLTISQLLGEKLFYNEKGNKAFLVLESKN